jgi:hypothetical protein
MQKTASYLQRILKILTLGLRSVIIIALMVIQASTVVIAGSAVFVLLTISCIAVSLGIYREVGQKHSHDTDDTQNYLVDIASFLGPEWFTGTIRREKDGDNIATSDIFGPDRSIIGRSDYSTGNRANSLAYFRQYAFLFTNESEANKHFDQEREWIFIYDYGVPISHQPFPYRDLELPPEIVFQADEYQVACTGNPVDNRCNALFRYENYVVFVDAVLVRDSVRYLTESDFIAILDLIDEKMSSRGNLVISQ